MAPCTLPPLGRSSSDTYLRCSKAVSSNAVASRASPSSLGAGRVDPKMRALLAAAQRIVDPKELPMSRPGSRSRARDAEDLTRLSHYTSPPALRRSSSVASQRSGQSQSSSTSPPRDSSANLGAGRIDPTMRALLAAAQRIVDPKGLPASRPASRDADISTRQIEGAEAVEPPKADERIVDPKGLPASRPASRDADISTRQIEGAEAVEPPKADDEAAFVYFSKKLLRSSRKPLREHILESAPGAWGTGEEICKLNGALEGLGQPRQVMQWASPDLEKLTLSQRRHGEKLWLRKETTSQLLQSLLENGTKVCSSNWMDCEVSTRASNSAATSGYATPQLV